MKDWVFRRRGLLASALLVAGVCSAVPWGAVPSGASSKEVSTVGSATTDQLMHDLYGPSLNDLLAGGTTANQKIDATAQLCKTGVTYDATSKVPNGSAAGKAALKAEETAAVTQRGCIDFVRSATPPEPDTSSTHFDYYAYALDAVAPLVGTAAGGSREDPPTLTLTDMKNIYKCKPGYTTWSGVTGGTSAPIVRFWPETGSDTRSIYADLLGFTPATTAKGTAGDTCTTKPITTFATVGGTGTHVTKANPENSEAGIVYQASVDNTTPIADAITIYSAGRFVQQWKTTAHFNMTATNSISGTAIGNFSASTLLLARMENRTTSAATQSFTIYGAPAAFSATTNRGTFAINTAVVKEANEWYSHLPHPTSPAATSTAPVPGVHYLYNVADTALSTYDEAKLLVGFDNQVTGTKSSLCHGDDSAAITAAGFVPLGTGVTAPDPTSDKAKANCREFPAKSYPGFGSTKSWADNTWVNPTVGGVAPATYTLRAGFPKEWDTYPWTSTITTVAVGDLIVVYLHANTTTGHVKSVQDSNNRITWHSAASIAGTDSTHLDQRLELWIGVVKSVGSTKITSTWTGSTADYFIYVWEFSSSLGSSAKWTVTASAFKTHGTTGPQTVTWPSLTSGSTGGIWVGTAYPGTKSSDVTTTPGFTYVFDVHGNPLVERVTLAANTAYAPKVKQTGGIRMYDAICLIAAAT